MEGTEQYRAALDEFAAETGHAEDRLQCRCLTLDPEMRADADKRTVDGIAVRYGAETRLRSFRERVRAGALAFPGAGAQNLTLQHDRALPIGRLEFVDSPEALRFRATLSAGARADQALADIDAGLLRGASMEFFPERVLTVESGVRPLMEITKGRVTRVSLVDVPQYPSSRFQVRADDGEPGRPDLRILPGPTAPDPHRPRRSDHWLS